jgi:hypothetical protein
MGRETLAQIPPLDELLQMLELTNLVLAISHVRDKGFIGRPGTSLALRPPSRTGAPVTSENLDRGMTDIVHPWPEMLAGQPQSSGKCAD